MVVSAEVSSELEVDAGGVSEFEELPLIRESMALTSDTTPPA